MQQFQFVILVEIWGPALHVYVYFMAPSIDYRVE